MEARTSGSRVAEFAVLSAMLDAQRGLEHLDEAERTATEALDLCRRSGLATFEVMMLGALALIALRWNQRSRALDIYRLASERASACAENGSNWFGFLNTFRKEAELILD